MSATLPASRAAARRPVRSDAVHDALRRDILTGVLRAGDAVPSERVLAARFGVNRHAVREAVKRLQEAGLVAVSQGGATRVLDWHRHGGLDLLADVAPLLAGAEAAEMLRSMAEMRASIGADAARLCARVAPGAARRELPALADAVVAAPEGEPRLLAYEALWQAIVVGSGNLAYRLAFNSLVAARHGSGLSGEIYAAELRASDGGRAVAGAIAAGDDEGAAAAARATLEHTIAAAG